MASTDPESVCFSKQSHPTKKDAARMARQSQAQYGGRWEAYRCPYCGNFHVGHTSRGNAAVKVRARRFVGY